MRTIVITPPAPVVSLDVAKDHLHVRHTTEDDKIERLIAAATAHIDGPDGWLGRALGVQTLEARFDGYAVPAEFCLRYPPAIEVVSVKYVDSARVEQTADSDAYELIGQTIYPIGSGSLPWSLAGSGRETIRIRYSAGYENGVPEPIVAAILLMVGDMYTFTETAVTGTISSSVAMSTTVENLLSPFRVWA